MKLAALTRSGVSLKSIVSTVKDTAKKVYETPVGETTVVTSEEIMALSASLTTLRQDRQAAIDAVNTAYSGRIAEIESKLADAKKALMPEATKQATQAALEKVRTLLDA